MSIYMVDGVAHGRRSWTDEEINFTREKWSAGWSASQIAGELEGRSRNSVISLVDRKAFTRAIGRTNQHSRSVDPVPRQPRAEKRKANSERPYVKAAQSAQPERRTRDKASYPKPIPGDISRYEQPNDGVGVSLDQLTNEMCRWPKGTPGDALFVFCGCLGADFSNSRPYCGPHNRRRTCDRHSR